MWTLLGAPALSAFRSARLLQKLTAVRSFTALRCYFVDLAAEPDAPQAARLERLLEARRMPAEPTGLWVVPRIGTISPWSSKATDIAAVCGLTAVRRIGQRIHYSFTGANAVDAALLHDRMTDSVLHAATEAA